MNDTVLIVCPISTDVRESVHPPFGSPRVLYDPVSWSITHKQHTMVYLVVRYSAFVDWVLSRIISSAQAISIKSHSDRRHLQKLNYLRVADTVMVAALSGRTWVILVIRSTADVSLVEGSWFVRVFWLIVHTATRNNQFCSFTWVASCTSAACSALQ